MSESDNTLAEAAGLVVYDSLDAFKGFADSFKECFGNELFQQIFLNEQNKELFSRKNFSSRHYEESMPRKDVEEIFENVMKDSQSMIALKVKA